MILLLKLIGTSAALVVVVAFGVWMLLHRDDVY